jgi:hypothetical protein
LGIWKSFTGDLEAFAIPGYTTYQTMSYNTSILIRPDHVPIYYPLVSIHQALVATHFRSIILVCIRQMALLATFGTFFYDPWHVL